MRMQQKSHQSKRIFSRNLSLRLLSGYDTCEKRKEKEDDEIDIVDQFIR